MEIPIDNVVVVRTDPGLRNNTRLPVAAREYKRFSVAQAR